MTRREGFLSKILVLVLSVSILGFSLYAILDTLQRTNNSVDFINSQISLLTPRIVDETGLNSLREIQDTLEAKINELNRKFYNPGEISIYAFANLVKEEVTRQKFNIRNFEIANNEQEIIISASGSDENVISLLHAISSMPKYWAVPYFTMVKAEKQFNIQIRVAYVSKNL